MSSRRQALTPEALTMMDTIARTGSFAAAAREMGRVPSALTYSVRQLEDALDVLLFDRRSRQARLTAAGRELLEEGRRLLAEMDAVANRVRRVATGWESELTIAVDGAMSRATLLELVESFYAVRPPKERRSAPEFPDTPGGRAGHPPGAAGTAHSETPGTRLRLRTETLAGLWESLVTGQADLAIGVITSAVPPHSGIEVRPLGEVMFVFAVAPHHPLARVEGPLRDADLIAHRAVAVADSAQRLSPITFNLLPGQDVLTVSSLQAKIDAQARGLGCGFVPEPLARPHIRAGRLVVKTVERARDAARFGYAWRSAQSASSRQAPLGLALKWWLEQLASPATRRALLERHVDAGALGLE